MILFVLSVFNGLINCIAYVWFGSQIVFMAVNMAGLVGLFVKAYTN